MGIGPAVHPYKRKGRYRASGWVYVMVTAVEGPVRVVEGDIDVIADLLLPIGLRRSQEGAG